MEMGKTIGHDPFSIDESGDNHFESLAKTNGIRYWYAIELMAILGYDSWTSFKKAINKAISACATLNISILENFTECTTIVDGKPAEDYKLSRFACCLTALNGDPKKEVVASAQAYFISLATMTHDLPVPADGADRLVIREKISEQERSLSRVAAAAGVQFFDRFQNAGYRGMYNMEYSELKKLKNIPDRRKSLLDFMNKEELAANLFRLTLTEGRMQRDKTKGQLESERVAEQVGKKVRDVLIDQTGVKPEQLPIGPFIGMVRSGLKQTSKGFKKLDNVQAEREAESIIMGQALSDLDLTSSGVKLGCAECLIDKPFSHDGSIQCTSGSIASGGILAHCSCDYCRQIPKYPI